MRLQQLRETVRRANDGNLEIFGGPQIDAAMAGRLRAAQIAIVARFTPAMMLANIFNACILMAAFWGTPSQAFTIGWGFSVISFSLFIYIKRRQGSPFQPGRTASRYAIRRAIRNGLFLGCMWALLPILLFPTATPAGQIIVIALSIGMLCGGALTLSPIPAAGLAFVVPLLFSSAVALSLTNEMVYKLVIGLLIVYAAVLFRAMFIYAGQAAVRFIAELEHEMAAQTDALTQLPNRIAFAEKLDFITERVRRLGESHSVLFLDLDRFKEINDSYGHASGDEFLIQAASRLRVSIRENDYVARISGDEFAIILVGIATSEQVAEVTERVLRSFQIPFRIRDADVKGSVTIGIGLLPADGADSDTIMQKADDALYAAKRDQRGTYRFFSDKDENHVQLRNEILRDLKHAIEHNDFHLEFQPFMDLGSGLTTGFEALLRWQHPTKGLISPGDFVPLAEEAGLIHEIGEWVIRHAISEAVRWPDHLRVAINVSAAQFRTVEIASIIEKAIAQSGISPERIEIEVTESMILADLERAVTALTKLQSIGVKIALDDFGTGYSSLIHLVRLPFDRIKIDHFFVSQLETSAECRKIVRAIIRLATEIGIEVIAEGVETEEQLRILKSTGCREGQGYFIARPLRDVRSSDMMVSCFPLVNRAA